VTPPPRVSCWHTVQSLVAFVKKGLTHLFNLSLSLFALVGMLSLDNRSSFSLLQSDPAKPFNFLQNFKSLDAIPEYVLVHSHPFWLKAPRDTYEMGKGAIVCRSA